MQLITAGDNLRRQSPPPPALFEAAACPGRDNSSLRRGHCHASQARGVQDDICYRFGTCFGCSKKPYRDFRHQVRLCGCHFQHLARHFVFNFRFACSFGCQPRATGCKPRLGTEERKLDGFNSSESAGGHGSACCCGQHYRELYDCTTVLLQVCSTLVHFIHGVCYIAAIISASLAGSPKEGGYIVLPGQRTSVCSRICLIY
eukprot:04689_5